MVLSATIPAARVRVVLELERLHEPKGGTGMRRLLLLAAALVVLLVPAVVGADVGVGPGGGTPGTSSNFELVGHNDLSGFELDGNISPRGMNAAPAIFDRFVYIGNRADGSSRCGIGDPRRETL
ncbi:MAG: hypothetical protein ACRD0V_19350, partial [Acidimicrobiales bacterium]